VLTYGGTVASIVAGAVLGAVLCPPLAAAISSRLPADFHPFIGNVTAMAIATSLIIPPLQLIPGFQP
jgi:ENTS family enterobactin (siderophore) exporter